MARIDPKFMLRLPVELRDQVQEAATQNNRSMNAEIIHRLQYTFDDPEGPLTDPEKDKLKDIVLEGITRTLLEAPEYAEYLDHRARELGEKVKREESGDPDARGKEIVDEMRSEEWKI